MVISEHPKWDLLFAVSRSIISWHFPVFIWKISNTVCHLVKNGYFEMIVRNCRCLGAGLSQKNIMRISSFPYWAGKQFEIENQIQVMTRWRDWVTIKNPSKIWANQVEPITWSGARDRENGDKSLSALKAINMVVSVLFTCVRQNASSILSDKISAILSLSINIWRNTVVSGESDA